MLAKEVCIKRSICGKPAENRKPVFFFFKVTTVFKERARTEKANRGNEWSILFF
jgi:hypothetical protein